MKQPYRPAPAGHRLDASLIKQTDRAYCVRPHGQQRDIWIPKRGTRMTTPETFFIPFDTARAKGLLPPIGAGRAEIAR